ncbi:NUDIX hydrolase [Nocardioides sp. Y6]|uniref:NUDIX hydrolase n=1 Tax=Nocardioides malaquae TaxID=2773426 RepID=A0ABR9RTG9_9ACTN|nr:bifunctional NUDIX hydrolase/histidine phosphatase family protein [Nocardioides malaquae]MBE7324868.1 NUDIX hydrolase [Nocardioides malaquae]
MADVDLATSNYLPDVIAAGAVVTRRSPATGERQVLLVHRPRYDDWSFPKGKVDPGEHVTACAVREVAEETGVRVRLGAPLLDQRYRVAGDRMKTVHYWMARVVGDDDVSRYAANKEIDVVEWVDWSRAAGRITYRRDREVLDDAWQHRRATKPVVVVRHGAALARKRWEGDDRRRPLTPEGRGQAAALAPVLGAYGITDLVSSSSTRCVETLQPYADSSGRALRTTAALSEEDATPAGVAEVVASVAGRRAALCSHRPVLPDVLAALGVAPTALEPGGFVVVHRRRNETWATETYPAP